MRGNVRTRLPQCMSLRPAVVLWLVRDGEIWGGFSLMSGLSCVYVWATDRLPSERWQTYVTRACADAQAAIQAAPREDEVAMPPKARMYFNLTWAGPDE